MLFLVIPQFTFSYINSVRILKKSNVMWYEILINANDSKPMKFS